MGLFFIHIIKSSFCLIAFYLAYKMFLSKETFHRANRFILLSIIVASMIIPAMQLTISAPSVAALPVRVHNFEQLLFKQPTQSGGFTTGLAEIIYPLLFCIYFIGFFVQLIISGINFIRIYKLANSAKQMPFGKYIIAVTTQQHPAFSWGKYIVLSEKEYAGNPEIIIQHELIHLERRHSLDLLLTEITIILFWFNPAVRLLTQELKDTHEFEVDSALISQGVDAKAYQLLLIRKAAGEKIYSIANTFNQSKLAVRIKMMLRQRSAPWASLKYLCIVVLSTFSIIAFAKPGIAENIQAMSTEKLGSFIKKQVNKISGPVKEDLPVKKEKQPDKAVSAPLTLSDHAPGSSVARADQQEIITGKEGTPICIVDGKPITYADFKLINPDDIKTVTVLKEKEATEAYGEKGKSGAIIISLFKERQPTVNNNAASLLKFMLSAVNKPKCVFFLNGTKLSDEQQVAINRALPSMANINNLIESIVTITGKEALDKYGDEGINGVLEIHLKSR
ncbi:M56 family metallopeptidase [Pedobacter miscanthi]|uniref:M56 family metallopeptidase n=1 Tax=Pedobacter miscanthi TaxID=2259170 RepID=UPI00292D12EF|nr:M56 family metallopeptidase [Pedobacter miscanthi]